MSDRYRVIGMMSGTSLDGLDLVLVWLNFKDQSWQFEIEQATTVSYPENLRASLTYNPNLGADTLDELDHKYGLWLGKQVLAFLDQNNLTTAEIDLIASHGHTLYHQPQKGYTKQIGCGIELPTTTGITCVTDFRRPDVALGGQGAPLVPIGDQLLFADNDACLNLGGFANISFVKNRQRTAFDIGPVNYIFNHLARKAGLEYDESGRLAQSGRLLKGVLDALNALPFYHLPAPKSLGAEWVNQEVFPILNQAEAAVADLLRTTVEHAAIQIAAVLNENEHKSCLVTGGGTFNHFLMNRIKALSVTEIVVPDALVINYKEALIFALLGVLRIRGEVNVLASVTGAAHDHSSGTIYHL